MSLLYGRPCSQKADPAHQSPSGHHGAGIHSLLRLCPALSGKPAGLLFQHGGNDAAAGRALCQIAGGTCGTAHRRNTLCAGDSQAVLRELPDHGRLLLPSGVHHLYSLDQVRCLSGGGASTVPLSRRGAAPSGAAQPHAAADSGGCGAKCAPLPHGGNGGRTSGVRNDSGGGTASAKGGGRSCEHCRRTHHR